MLVLIAVEDEVKYGVDAKKFIFLHGMCFLPTSQKSKPWELCHASIITEVIMVYSDKESPHRSIIFKREGQPSGAFENLVAGKH
jgi:hypothetical protein